MPGVGAWLYFPFLGFRAFLTQPQANPHFSRISYYDLLHGTVTAFGLFPPQAGCTHPALRRQLRQPCHRAVHFVSQRKSVRNAG